MLTRFARSTALALALTGLGVGLAAADDSFVPPFVSQWDLDGDGTVTPDEMRTRRADLFAMFDEDENGILEADELKLMAETSAAQQDAMGDQRAEMQAMRSPQGMQGMAGKRQGMQGMRRPQGKAGMQGMAGMQDMRPAPGKADMQGMQGMQGMGGMRGMQGMNGMAGIQPHDDVAMADANKDGKLTRDEFMALSEMPLTMLDRNKDGVISAADFAIDQ